MYFLPDDRIGMSCLRKSAGCSCNFTWQYIGRTQDQSIYNNKHPICNRLDKHPYLQDPIYNQIESQTAPSDCRLRILHHIRGMVDNKKSTLSASSSARDISSCTYPTVPLPFWHVQLHLPKPCVCASFLLPDALLP